MTSFEEFRLWLDVVAILVALGSIVYAHVRTKDAARQQQISDLENRLTKAEGKLEETPTSKAIHELAIAIEHLSGDLRATVERLNGLSGIVERLEKAAVRQEDYLRNARSRD